METHNNFNGLVLKEKLKGDLYFDEVQRLIYATDASAYKEIPLAVARPACNEDIKELILFAHQNNISLIPRAAGTSLAGQVVGNGIIVDVSRYMNAIIELNTNEKWVKVQPGAVLDELNLFLKPHQLFFGPETSTANRCMMGGMLGNNACGAHSLIYGSTRDHTIEVSGYLPNGDFVTFKPLSNGECESKLKLDTLEGNLYRQAFNMLSDKTNQDNIINNYPKPEIKRRNNGYALDQLLYSSWFGLGNDNFNFAKLIAGSEGTLLFVTEIKLNLVPLPPTEKALLCVHFNTLEEALLGNLLALKYNPGAIELIDDIILKCTRSSIEQNKNRFFIQGEPGAIIIVEWARDSKEEILSLANQLEHELRGAGLGYHFPLLTGTDINKVWTLRKAGLGLLSNIPGDAKPVSLIEDTAVSPYDLTDYIKDFKLILKKHELTCVFHAHIATGELHLRPVLDLKKSEDVKKFRQIATDVAHLVKKYRGSLSGEHGDGRLRGEFIPIIIGDHNYTLLKNVKELWDPKKIFNPGKITNTPAMDSHLRFTPDIESKVFDTYFDYSDSLGFMRHIEKCNGSGDCRKSHLIGGTMCPSYMASKDENATTRARANILREYLSNPKIKKPFASHEVYDILDLCLSCKGCKSECPSGVDMAKLKAEFLQHFYSLKGTPLSVWMIANITRFNRMASTFPSFYNALVRNSVSSQLIKGLLGFAKERNLPLLHRVTLRKWFRKMELALNNDKSDNKKLYLFIDEFTNYNDVNVGIKVLGLLSSLGYKLELIPVTESGRTYISKGLLKEARNLMEKNISRLKVCLSNDIPVIGIEPSALLTFRDEYSELVRPEYRASSKSFASKCFLVEEFLAKEFQDGKISADLFVDDTKEILLHGHCQQKAIASTVPVKIVLAIPKNYKVKEIASGCCGMAGSFGYEKRHFDLSMKIGELVLFPEVRKASNQTVIAAPGTSCRHQIFDGTGRSVVHPAEILFDALKQPKLIK